MSQQYDHDDFVFQNSLKRKSSAIDSPQRNVFKIYMMITLIKVVRDRLIDEKIVADLAMEIK